MSASVMAKCFPPAYSKQAIERCQPLMSLRTYWAFGTQDCCMKTVIQSKKWEKRFCSPLVNDKSPVYKQFFIVRWENGDKTLIRSRTTLEAWPSHVLKTDVAEMNVSSAVGAKYFSRSDTKRLGTSGRAIWRLRERQTAFRGDMCAGLSIKRIAQ